MIKSYLKREVTKKEKKQHEKRGHDFRSRRDLNIFREHYTQLYTEKKNLTLNNCEEDFCQNCPWQYQKRNQNERNTLEKMEKIIK